MDEFTGKRVVYVGVGADRKESYNFPYQNTQPAIAVKCMDKELDVTFGFRHPLKGDWRTDTVEVMLKYDDEKIITFDGYERTDSTSVFAPNALWSAKKLAKVTKVSVRATPPFAAQVTFYVDNIPPSFGEHVKTVVEACGLNL